MKQLLKIELNENVVVKKEGMIDEQKLMQLIAMGVTDLLNHQKTDYTNVESILEQYLELEAIGHLALYLRYHDYLQECYLLKAYDLEIKPMTIILYQDKEHYRIKTDYHESSLKLAIFIYAIIIARGLSAKNQHLLLFSLYCLFFEQGGDDNG